MKGDAQCMYKELLLRPHGADHIRLGAFHDKFGALPYVEYRSRPNKRGFRQIVRFEASRGCSASEPSDCCSEGKRNYCFQTVLPGLVSAGESDADDWDAGLVTKDWENYCHVRADILFV
jgi:hypothetical protein